MGKYHSQYETYYAGAASGKGKINNYSHSNRNRSIKKQKSIFNKLIFQLIGAFILVSIFLGCKLITTPETSMVYNYSKQIIDENYDYSVIVEKVKTIEISDLQNLDSKAQEFIDNVKMKITGNQSIKDSVKQEYILPVNVDVDYTMENINIENTMNIPLPEGTDVVVIYNGTVTETGDNEELGKYIKIDHGRGIESIYSNLNEVNVAKDSAVNKGEIIAKSGAKGNLDSEHLSFQLLYMGQKVNPEGYLNFQK